MSCPPCALSQDALSACAHQAIANNVLACTDQCFLTARYDQLCGEEEEFITILSDVYFLYRTLSMRVWKMKTFPTHLLLQNHASRNAKDHYVRIEEHFIVNTKLLNMSSRAPLSAIEGSQKKDSNYVQRHFLDLSMQARRNISSCVEVRSPS